MPSKLTKWLKWLDAIHIDLQNIKTNQHIFWRIQEFFVNNHNIKGPNDFNRFLIEGYLASSVMNIRRQIKDKNDSISFARLLSELIDTPHILSKEYFISNYEKNPTSLEWVDEDFKRFAHKGDQHVAADKVKNDLNNLKEKAKNIERIADKKIAHLDKNSEKIKIDTSELDDCIDYLVELFKKYHILFKGYEGAIEDEPRYDWTSIFNVAWLQTTNK